MESTFEEKFKKLKEGMASLTSEAHRLQTGRNQVIGAWSKEQRIQLARKYEHMKEIKNRLGKIHDEAMWTSLKFQQAKQRLVIIPYRKHQDPKVGQQQPRESTKLKIKEFLKQNKEECQHVKTTKVALKKYDNQSKANNGSETLYHLKNIVEQAQDMETENNLNHEIEQIQDMETQNIINDDVEKIQDVETQNNLIIETVEEEEEENNDTRKIVNAQEISENENEPLNEKIVNQIVKSPKRSLSKDENQDKIDPRSSHKKIKLDSYDVSDTESLHILASMAFQRIQESSSTQPSQTINDHANKNNNIDHKLKGSYEMKSIFDMSLKEVEENNEYCSQTDQIDDVAQKLDEEEEMDHCSEADTTTTEDNSVVASSSSNDYSTMNNEDNDHSQDNGDEEIGHCSQTNGEETLTDPNPTFITEQEEEDSNSTVGVETFEAIQANNSLLQHEDAKCTEIGVKHNAVKENSEFNSKSSLELSSNNNLDSEGELHIDITENPNDDEDSCADAPSVNNNTEKKKRSSYSEDHDEEKILDSSEDSNSAVASSSSNDYSTMNQSKKDKRKSVQAKVVKWLKKNPERGDLINAVQVLVRHLEQTKRISTE